MFVLGLQRPYIYSTSMLKHTIKHLLKMFGLQGKIVPNTKPTQFKSEFR